MKLTNRQIAGQLLAEKIKTIPSPEPLIILAISKGGTLVASPIAQKWDAPLDLLLIRQLNVPDDDKIMGAVGPRGAAWFDHDLIQQYHISFGDVFGVEARERLLLDRQIQNLHQEKPVLPISGHCVLLVDESLTETGPMELALHILQTIDIPWCGIATPLVVTSVRQKLQPLVNEFIYIATSPSIHPPQNIYYDCPPVSDEEIRYHLNLNTYKQMDLAL